jgi:hypothetical protein
MPRKSNPALETELEEAIQEVVLSPGITGHSKQMEIVMSHFKAGRMRTLT